MAPALRHGDQLVVRYGGSVRPGDVIVVALPGRPPAVKRLMEVDAEGSVWVEGDNPFGSTDSRELGSLPASAVLGRVVARLWPRPAGARSFRPPRLGEPPTQ